MRKYTWPTALMLACTVAFTGACAGDGDDLAEDTTLSSDLALAGQDSLAEPALTDVPAEQPSTSQPATRPSTTRPSTTRPSTSTPAPSRPATTPSGNTVTSGTRGSEGSLATIPAGTNITLTSGERVCTNTHKPGDKFTATVSEAVMGSDGAVIPAGSRAVVQVTSVDQSENVNDPARIGLVVQQIVVDGKAYPVDATITSASVEQVRTASKGSDAKKVIGGAVAGAILGQVLGKDTKSTVIGAATGAAAGTAIAMGTGDHAGCIPSGGTIAIRLNTPARVSAD
ncbi:MAG TPA: glycine zipper 2TM domain-containing protein [Gemmatimonadaceae bacterium]|nr:glycine zipper 2TM domain-containing protein [Gemmatimonadaceae bacterium]